MLTTLMQPIPQAYKEPAEQQGRIIRVDYQTEGKNKYAFVYVPYEFDPTQFYDIFYLLHGGGGSAENLFGQEGDSVDIKNAVDHLIEEGVIPPVVMVAPTYYTETFSDKTPVGSGAAVRHFMKELQEDLIPAIEGDNRVSRERRYIGGFSMGSVTTWYALQYCLDDFYTFLPMCGDSWAMGMKAGGTLPEQTVQALAEAVEAQGYGPEDFFVFAMNGSRDISEPNMSPMFDVIENQPGMFDMREGGNTMYLLQDGGVHSADCAKQYFFFALQEMYN